jgi:hypothetical protein
MQAGDYYIGKTFTYLILAIEGQRIICRRYRAGEYHSHAELDSSFFRLYCEKQLEDGAEEEILELNYRKPQRLSDEERMDEIRQRMLNWRDSNYD